MALALVAARLLCFLVRMCLGLGLGLRLRLGRGLCRLGGCEQSKGVLW